MTSSAGDLLRGLAVFPDGMRPFDPGSAPESPHDLFLRWLAAAIDDGVPAPHAVVLSTADGDGCPDARVVVLRDLDEGGFSFATSSDSPKGRQLNATPHAALTFFWQAAGRQIRVSGPVTPASAEENDADFRRRHPAARALVLAGEQSEPILAGESVSAAVERELDGIEGRGSATWTVYRVAPERIEFWQADADRRHTRLRYVRSGEGWRRELLWP
ncbi:pyridoxal 5'-phosphate synthase [Arthrobacter sp. JZ12]|uniref:pyridoxine/pyridoxamine 5'-phosphate oxidase n=1 Tax=Arthrobacter sp. JZ12 TaxID=2654190 RepID=UPI002B4A3778|nr:pyridoxal 5'-phosphate synthase [Arthrobacter sp. JZ12]WRH26055.1 pyridoxal 5'-phosphate synthase [Arthrobacter sp. JZ12]